MKTLHEYLSESEVDEAAPDLDMKNAVVKKLAAACSKNGYQLKKAFFLTGRGVATPVIEIAGSGPGWHPVISYSTLDRPPLSVKLSVDAVVNKSDSISFYLDGLKGCEKVVKTLESLDLTKLPSVSK